MECHDARILLTFAQRRCEKLDASEHAALQQHVDGCPDCAARIQAEHQADAAIGRLMLDVPIPADLKGKVLKRLAEQRLGKPWRKPATVAALVLIALLAGGIWYAVRTPVVTVEGVQEYFYKGNGAKDEEVEADFQKLGIEIRLPGNFKDKFLKHAEVVEFKSQRVVKLSYRTSNDDGSTGIVDVLVLRNRDFRLDKLANGPILGTNITIIKNDDFTYLILQSGNIDRVVRPPA